MRFIALLFLSFPWFIPSLQAQNPETAPLPDRFANLGEALVVNHFPSPVYASRDADEKKYTYFWKHTTSVMSPNSDIQVTNCGAYIYYGNQWNERVTFSAKEFAKMFGCSDAKMKQGQPYTFANNWRHENELSGGWAMWWFMGKNDKGETVYGLGKLETVGSLQPEPAAAGTYAIDRDASSLKWTGHAETGTYAPVGTLRPASASLSTSAGKVTMAKLRIDMRSLTGEEASLVEHIRNSDFFDVEKFPAADFELIGELQVGKENQAANGKFRVCGIEVEWPFTASVRQEGGKLIVSGQLQLDRSSFGITKNSVKHSKTAFNTDHAISDLFELDFVLVFGM